MPTSYKNKIYTTLGTPTNLSGDVVFATDSTGVPAKDYTVKGRTVVWNQLLNKDNYRTRTINGVTLTANDDGTITANGTATGLISYDLLANYGIAGHKYCCYGCPAGGSISTYRITNSIHNLNGDYVRGFSDEGNGGISPIVLSADQYNNSAITIASGITMNNLVFKPQIFDLTDIFGAGNEPTTPREFRAMFPDDYYPYNEGELKTIVPTSVEASGVERFQLLDKSKYHATITKNGVTFTNNGDGSITVNGTCELSAGYELFSLYGYPKPSEGGKVGHKYGVFGCPSGGSNGSTYRISASIRNSDGGYSSGFSDTGEGRISENAITEGQYVLCEIIIYAGYTANNLVFKPQLFDLTQMFGVGNEPSSVDEFFYRIAVSYSITDKSRYESSKPNTTYTVNGITFAVQNDGSILCNGTVGTTTNYAGFYYNSKVSNVLGNTLYKDHLYFILGSSPQHVNTTTLNNSAPYRIVKVLETSSEARLYFAYSPSGTVVNNQWMYPLAIDLTELYGAGNEPRTVDDFRRRFLFFGYDPDAHKMNPVNTVKWFPDGMRSAGTAYDEINFLSQKAIKRIGAVDMGTLNWSYHTMSASHERFEAAVSGIKLVSEASIKGNLVCSKYTVASATNVYLHAADKTIAVHNTVEQVWVYDTSYTDAATFKAAMSGVMLYYELATPVETAITPPLQSLSTYKGFNSFSAPNSLMQNGPLSITYYAEGGANPESGWLTSYKRKLYMGRNIEWNQLMDKSWNYPTLVTANGVTFTKNTDGSVSAIGTVGTSPNYSSCYFTTALTTVTNHIYLCRDCAPQNFNFTNLLSVKGVGSIFKANEATTTGRLFKAFSPSGASVNYIIKPQLYDLTLMFGAGNEPSTIDEFYQYFGNGFYDYNTGETQPLFKISRKSQWGSI